MVEKTVTEIRERHEREIKAFQAQCSHPRARWLPYCWAIGHFTGEIVLSCEVCQKELDRKQLPEDWQHCERWVDKDGETHIKLPKIFEYAKQETEALGVANG